MMGGGGKESHNHSRNPVSPGRNPKFPAASPRLILVPTTEFMMTTSVSGRIDGSRLRTCHPGSHNPGTTNITP